MNEMQTEIEIPTPDGPMSALVQRPDATPLGTVVVLMEAFGVNAHIRDLLGRFADAGYIALAPDLYHRQGRLRWAAYDDLPMAMSLFSGLTTAALADDLAATVRAAHELGPAGAPVSVIGFCLGGYAAVLAALRAAPDVVIGFYGAGLSIPRDGSPLDPLAEQFSALACSVHLFYGADDPVIPEAEVASTKRALTKAGIGHTVTVYPGAGHGFFCDARASYVAAAADDAWPRVLDAIRGSTPRTGTRS